MVNSEYLMVNLEYLMVYWYIISQGLLPTRCILNWWVQGYAEIKLVTPQTAYVLMGNSNVASYLLHATDPWQKSKTPWIKMSPGTLLITDPAPLKDRIVSLKQCKFESLFCNSVL